MERIVIKAPQGVDVGSHKSWEACYKVTKGNGAIHVGIEARSAVEVIVAKLPDVYGYGGFNYYISSPNFNVAIPNIGTLHETWWIMEKLINNDMPAADAVTVATVLAVIGDF